MLNLWLIEIADMRMYFYLNPFDVTKEIMIDNFFLNAVMVKYEIRLFCFISMLQVTVVLVIICLSILSRWRESKSNYMSPEIIKSNFVTYARYISFILWCTFYRWNLFIFMYRASHRRSKKRKGFFRVDFLFFKWIKLFHWYLNNDRYI